MFDYTAPIELLKDKVIMVTGAGSGLGRAAALTYAQHGATVILVGKTLEKLEQVYDEIDEAGGSQGVIVSLDLEKAGDNDYMRLSEEIGEEFGRLDGLLHNAGITSNTLPLQAITLTSWNQLLQVNLTAGFALTKYCLPLLSEAENASIIFTSSTAGRETRAYWGAYAVSKHGVETLMEILAQEMENTSKIRVNSINPGPCATALRKVIFPSEDQSKVPAPEDLMAVYLYLMGKDSLQENGKKFSAQESQNV